MLSQTTKVTISKVTAGLATFALVLGILGTPLAVGANHTDSNPNNNFPTSKEQCKNNGYKQFHIFKNQGQCIKFVNQLGGGGYGNPNPPAPGPIIRNILNEIGKFIRDLLKDIGQLFGTV